MYLFELLTELYKYNETTQICLLFENNMYDIYNLKEEVIPCFENDEDKTTILCIYIMDKTDEYETVGNLIKKLSNYKDQKVCITDNYHIEIINNIIIQDNIIILEGF